MVLLVAALANAVALVVLPATLAAAVDAQIRGAGSGSALPWLGIVLAVLVGTEAVTELAAPASTAAATRWLRHGFLRHVVALGVPGRDRFAAGDVVSRLVSNAAEAGGGAPALARAVSSIAVSIGGLVALTLIDVLLALTFLAGVPLGLLLIRAFVAKTADLVARYLATYGAIAARLTDALGGGRTIRAAGTLDQEVARVLAPVSELGRTGHAMWAAQGRVGWQSSLLMPGLQIAVLSVAGYGLAAGRVTPGQLLATIGYVVLSLAFMEQAGIMMALARARGGARRLTDVLAQRPPQPAQGRLRDGPGEVVFEEVTVRVGDRTVLDRLDLTIPPGRSVAVIGASAAGKSTLAAVVGRLIDPEAGRVLLDGVPVTRVDSTILRREVAYAFERPALLGTTVADAIAFGHAPVPETRIRNAARLAYADAFIRRLPDGYDTPIERAPMSGGEAQRVGLARALAQGGRLLILDDATSSLDTVTELQVSRALTKALTGRTRIIIAHRLATVSRCDLVAWLENGRLRALAPHDVLWRDADYRTLFQSAEAA